jgi:peptidoglycan/xylan/chitin deacetylase (PgdA/CDA1 family)
MHHQKKRSFRHCKIHPEIQALGRCSKCKSFVCNQCSKKILHQLYCDRCAPKKSPGETAAPPPPEVVLPLPQTQTHSRQPQKLQSLVLLAGITLALCGLVFGVWNMKNTAELSTQNNLLREKRIELLKQIKVRNQEISSLRRQLDSLQSVNNTSDKNKPLSFFPPSYSLPPQIPGLPISFDNGSPQKRLVCLTFDGGAIANAAIDILDTLNSRGVKATMFLSGEFLRKYTDIVLRIVRDGHEAGNHLFSHPRLTSYSIDGTQSLLQNISEGYLAHELFKTDSLFRVITGIPLAPFWRAPYGEYNRIICAWAQHAGFIHVGWRQGKTWKQGLDSNDWIPDEESRGYRTPQEVYDKIVGLATESENGICGGIILMHLGTVRTQKDKQVHQMLGRLIDTLRSLNYRFVPVSEMLKESGVDIRLLKDGSTNER